MAQPQIDIKVPPELPASMKEFIEKFAAPSGGIIMPVPPAGRATRLVAVRG